MNHKRLWLPVAAALALVVGLPMSARQISPTSNTLGWDYDRRYDQNAYLEAHNSYASGELYNFTYSSQDHFVHRQMTDAAVRSLDLRYYMVRQTQAKINDQPFGYWNARIYCDQTQSGYQGRGYYDTDILLGALYPYNDVLPQIVLGHHIEDMGYLHFAFNGAANGFLPVDRCKSYDILKTFLPGSNSRYPFPGLATFLFNTFWMLSQPGMRTEILTLNSDSLVPIGPQPFLGGFTAGNATDEVIRTTLGMMADGIVAADGPGEGYGYFTLGANEQGDGRAAGEDLIANKWNAELEDLGAVLSFGFLDEGRRPINIFKPSPDQVNYGVDDRYRNDDTPFVPNGPGWRTPRPDGLRPKPKEIWSQIQQNYIQFPGWWVPMDGYPTIRQLVDNRFRVVALPDNHTWDERKAWSGPGALGVKTCAAECLTAGYWKEGGDPPDLWTKALRENKSLFMMEHSPEEANEDSSYVDPPFFPTKIDMTVDYFRGIPNFLRVDKTTRHAPQFAAAVRQINSYWAQVPEIDPIAEIVDTPAMQNGWFRGPVKVRMSGVAHDVGSTTPRAIDEVNWELFSERNRPEDLASGVGIQDPLNPLFHIKSWGNANARSVDSVTVCEEGKNVISFAGVDTPTDGVWSIGDRGYVDVWIDRLPPNLESTSLVGYPALINGWYASPPQLKITFNDLAGVVTRVGDTECGYYDHSGMQSTSGVDLARSTTVVEVGEGASAPVQAVAFDNAGNSKTFTLPGYNVDLTPPQILGLPEGCVLPMSNSLIPLRDIIAVDALSGVARFDVFVTSSEGPASDVVVTGAGVDPRSIQLRASRLTESTPRVYTITAVTEDVAGHVSEAEASCTVPVPGDENADGVVNCLDLAIVQAELDRQRNGRGNGRGSGGPGGDGGIVDLRADADGDGEIDQQDLNYVRKRMPRGTRCGKDAAVFGDLIPATPIGAFTPGLVLTIATLGVWLSTGRRRNMTAPR